MTKVNTFKCDYDQQKCVPITQLTDAVDWGSFANEGDCDKYCTVDNINQEQTSGGRWWCDTQKAGPSCTQDKNRSWINGNMDRSWQQANDGWATKDDCENAIKSGLEPC